MTGIRMIRLFSLVSLFFVGSDGAGGAACFGQDGRLRARERLHARRLRSGRSTPHATILNGFAFYEKRAFLHS